MNIYYLNPQFEKLPYELQNHICSFLPPHPIKNMITKCCFCDKVKDCHKMKWKSFLCKECVNAVGYCVLKGVEMKCNCNKCENILSNCYYGIDTKYDEYESFEEIYNAIILDNSDK